MLDVDDQVAAAGVFAAITGTVVRGGDLEEDESQGLPVGRPHVGDPALADDRIRRVDFASFMTTALTDDSLVGAAPAVVGRLSPSAPAHVNDTRTARPGPAPEGDAVVRSGRRLVDRGGGVVDRRARRTATGVDDESPTPPS
ncbi:hypothetical protein FHR81_000099 [Actinoalloteichus hoggarensis]|uniref:hypothetical protein n=1 Tax=Actinoalloteichus hoggarensis TaxID=1470176 RepID=UPI0018339CF3|nr:hypothetical protein [Actinoalloteichus hoggarensis]MBB5919070.1 hypothetical protein [Actinoalloteichus hoggarensis]